MNTQNTNLPVSNPTKSEELTQTYFNGYFDEEITIDASLHDAIYSFFLRELGDKSSANAFTHSLITISNETNTNPMDLLDQFTSSNGISINTFMAALINTTRRNTSLIGLNQPKTSNTVVARNILP